MKSIIPSVLLALIFSSCTTAYKNSQTPDDVYYSPERPREEYVRTETKKEKHRYEEFYEEDRYLRMKVRNYRRWSEFDNDWYSYSPYYSRYNFNNPWNSYSYWNYYYNPYCRNNVIIVNPKTAVNNRPRQYNLHIFDDPKVTSKNPKASVGTYTPVSTSNQNHENYRGSGNNAGEFLRGMFGNSGSSSNSSGSTSSSSTSSGSSGSSSSSSGNSSGSKSGSSGTSTRRF